MLKGNKNLCDVFRHGDLETPHSDLKMDDVNMCFGLMCLTEINLLK